MKSVRLLPVVILAALALLIFKGVGLVTTGGYIFDGEVQAAGDAAKDEQPVAEGEETTMSLPSEPTMDDTSPTLGDAAPTLAVADETGGEAGREGELATEGAEAPPAETAPTTETAATGDEAPVVPDLDAPPEAAADPRAEGVPMVQNEAGEIVPLTAEDGGSLTETIVLERLRARRAELDSREEELALRLQLIEAAEAKLDERATALAAVEARINALVDEKKEAEDGQFAAIVSMYEQMKPSDAAQIFNDLDMQVLLRVARGMNPRKMAPVMAKMTTGRAQLLTLALAAVEPEPEFVPETGGEDLASLPQIVGE